METMIENDIFRFVALRPPVSPEPQDAELNFIRDPREIIVTPVAGTATPVADFARWLYQLEPSVIGSQIEQFAPQFDVRTLGKERTFRQLLAAYDLAYGLTAKTFDTLEKGITQVLGMSAKAFIGGNYFPNMRDKIWDYYYVAYMLSLYKIQNMELHTKGLRACHLLTFVAAGTINKFASLGKILNATPVIDKLFTDIPQAPLKELTLEENPVSAIQIEEYKELWNNLIDTNRAMDEIKNLRFDVEEITETVDSSEFQGASEPDPQPYVRPGDIPRNPNFNPELIRQRPGLQEILQSVKDSKELAGVARETVETSGDKMQVIGTVSIPNKGSYEKLDSRTKAILNSHNVNEGNISVPDVVNRLQSQMSDLFLEISRQKDPEFLKQMPVAANKISGLQPVIKSMVPRALNRRRPRNAGNANQSILKPLGIADLKVVKMYLKKYMAGEIAHIENVLRGESKERSHRITERSETIFTTSLEQEEEQSKDTQSNERLQLKSEVEKTVDEMMKADAGTTVTGKFGPVTVEVNGSFGWQKTTKDVSKLSSDHAREVINKSVSRLLKKIKEERVSKNLHETEEINKHAINNSGKDTHAVGIYRWVDMLYEARLYNYGKRLMMQFMIPEPSAYYKYAKQEYENMLKENAVDGLECPEAFTLASPADINEWNYLTFIKKYNVEGMEPPPPLYQHISASLSKTAENHDGAVPYDISTNESSSTPLQIPDGYKVEHLNRDTLYNFSCLLAREAKWCDAAYDVSIGSQAICSLVGTDRGRDMKWARTLRVSSVDSGAIPLRVSTRNILAYALSVDVRCTRTENKMMEWKIKTYSAILQSYQNMKIAYEQKHAVQREAVVITGQNPAINRDIEKTELKKQCIRMLMENCQGQKFGDFDAMKVNKNNDVDFDIVDAIGEGDHIQFFEQAFEWENMSFVYYPYFWANQAQWIDKFMTYDTDPQFTKFLQAGSARVMLPVREGYNDVVGNYLRTGKVWGGGDAPVADDPLFMAVADELKNQTDNSDDQEPEYTWEVVVPTTQIYLQQDEVPLPVFD